MNGIASLRERISRSRKVIVLTLLLVLFGGSAVVAIAPAAAVTTTNCTVIAGVTNCNPQAGGANATFSGEQRKVFYANGYWWIFYATTQVGGNWIDYQSCPAPAASPSSITACSVTSDWSTPAEFTAAGFATSVSGQGFSAWLVPGTDTLVYATAPANTGGNFFWGVATLTGPTPTFVETNVAYSMLASHLGTNNPGISITTDGNNYMWIAVFTTASGSYYEDVYECPYNVVTSAASCTTASNWDTTTTFKLSETNDILDMPTILPLNSGGVYYAALVYIDALTSGSGGPMEIYVSPSGSASAGGILWQYNCGGGSGTEVSPPVAASCSTTTDMVPVESSLSLGNGLGGYIYSAVSSGATIYIVALQPGPDMASFSYTEGAAVYSGYDAWLGASEDVTLSVAGSDIVMTYAAGNVVFTWATMAGITSGAPNWSANIGLAVNTEWSPSQADASPYAVTIGGYTVIGVIWENTVNNPTPPNTNRIRFAVESMSPSPACSPNCVVDFPTTVTLSLTEYDAPASINSPISTSNYFPISYTNSAGVANTTYYTSSTGQVMTIKNVLSYSNFEIAEQSSASTSAEKWCLVYGNNCPNGQVSAFTTLGASDGLTLAYYYYDQLYEPNLYAIATTAIYSLWTTTTASYSTSNYETTNVGSPIPNMAGFTLYPNPSGATSWESPHLSLYTSATGYDEFTQWVRTRDVAPGCTALTIYENPIPNGGTTCAPSTSFANPFGTAAAGTGAQTINVNGENWLAGQWIGYKIEFLSGNAAGQSIVITASTTNSISVAPSSFNPAPSSGDPFTIVEPAVTVNNPSVTAPTTGPAISDYVPIVITNYENSPTVSGFQQLVTVNSNTYAQYEAPNLWNVEFFNGAGTVLSSWLESGNSNTAPATDYWLNLGASTIAAGTVGNVYFSGATAVTTAGTTAKVLQDTSAAWTVNAYIGDYLYYTSGTANGQWLPIVSNTANTITTESASAGTAFFPAPHAVGDTFEIVAINPGTLTVYMGFGPTGQNLFSSAGPEGEAPQLSPTYGEWDDGLAVFPAMYTAFNGPMPFAAVAGNAATISESDGLTITTSPAVSDGGVASTSAYSTASPLTFMTDVVSVQGVAAGFAEQNGVLLASTGYAFSYWAGSVSSGCMSCAQVNTGNPLQQIVPGVMGMTWVAGTAGVSGEQYYYKDYAQTDGTLATYTIPANVNIALGLWTGSVSSSITLQWARLQTAAPAGVMPSAVVGPVTSMSATPEKLVEYVPITITNNQATATPNYFQVDVNVTASTYFGYENALMQNVEFFTDSNPLTTAGTVMPSWLESGNSNTATDTVFWVRLPGSVAASGGTATIYMGLAPTSTNLFCASTYYTPPSTTKNCSAGGNGANGYVGESPLLSTGYGSSGYGVYDNGAVVFNLYDNFAGNSLDTNFATDSLLVSQQGATVTIGKLTNNACAANLPTSTGGEISTPGVSAFYGGNLWVVDKCDNRVLEYSAASLSSNNPTPILVIGQTSLNVGLPNEGAPESAAGLFDPTGIAFDASGDLWVSDSGNNRVLEYTAPLFTGEAATLVLGQAAFNTNAAALTAVGENTPTGLAFYGGNLWVVDGGNNRVIEYLSPFSTGEAATGYLGEPNLTTNADTSANTGLWGPVSLAFDSSGNLWVADMFNDRVVRFPAPLTSDEAATMMVGQPTFSFGNNIGKANAGIGVTGMGLNAPSSVAVDAAGDLWVADMLNNRVVEFSVSQLNTVAVAMGTATASTVSSVTVAGSPYTAGALIGEVLWITGGGDAGQYLTITSNTANTISVAPSTFTAAPGANTFTIMPVAKEVVGQTSVTASNFNDGSNYVNGAGIYNPLSITFDSHGNLWVSDSTNNRVLEFASASLVSFGPSASIVVGNSVFTSGVTTGDVASATSLNDPEDEAFDSAGDLWVVDSGNNRILEYKNPFYTGEPASVEIGQPAGSSQFTTTGSGLSASALNDPTAIAFDSSGNLWVVDSGNNRVLEFPAPFTNGESASTVIGQVSLTSNVSGSGASSLNDPMSIAFDQYGDLWVADSLNNRVLMFPAPLSTGESATIAVGQTSLSSNTSGTSATTLKDPMAITFDQYGDLWVADTGNNRVIQFPYYTLTTAPPSAAAANLVLGQFGLTTGLEDQGGNIAATSLDQPMGIAFDKWGDLFISDTGNNRVLEYQPYWGATFLNSQGEYIELGGSNINVGIPDRYQYSAIGPAPMSAPRGIAVDPEDAIWIADSANNRDWGSVTGTAPGSITVNDGLTIRYTSTDMGVTSEAMVNPRTNIFEMDSYFSSPNSGDTVGGFIPQYLYTTSVSDSTPALPGSGFNYLYAVSTGGIAGISGTELYNAGSGSAALLGDLILPVQIPTNTWEEPYTTGTGIGADGLEPNPAGSAQYIFVPTQNVGTAATSWWAIRNSTQSVTDTMSQPGERWTSPNNLAWTGLTSAFEVAPVDLYYLQYQETFQVMTGGLVTSFDPGVNIQLLGTEYGVAGSQVASFSLGSTSFTTYVDAGTTIIFPATATGAPSGSRWQNSNNQSQTAIITGPQTCTTLCSATYYKQYAQELGYTTSDGSTLPLVTPPVLTFTAFGTSTSAPVNPIPTRQIWVDADTVASVTGVAFGSNPSVERWVIAGDIWVISCSNEETLSCSSTSGVSGTGTGGSALDVSGSPWINDQWAPPGQQYYLVYTSGAAKGEYQVILSNTNNQIVTGAFGPVTPTPDETFSITGGLPNPVTYYHQFIQQITDYKTSDYSTVSSNTAPALTYPENGTTITLPLNYTGSDYLGPSTVSSATPTTMTASGAPGWGSNQWAGYTLEYPTLGLSEKILSNTGSMLTTDKFSSVPSSGAPFIIVYDTWMDANEMTSACTVGATHYDACVQSNLSAIADPASEQWYAAINTWVILGSNCQGSVCQPTSPGAMGMIGPFANSSILYDHQFEITYETVPGGLTIEACQYPLTTCTFIPRELNVAMWETTPMDINTAGNSEYLPVKIGSSGVPICLIPPPYTGSCGQLVSGNAAQAQLSGTGVITGYFNLDQGVTFLQTGISETPTDLTTWEVTVTNLGLMNSTEGASSSLALSINLVCDTVCNYSYTVESPVYNQFGDVRYFVTDSSGMFQLSSSVQSTTEDLTFNAQYRLLVLSDPLYTASFTGSYTNSTGSPSSGSISGVSSVTIWLTPGSTASVTETVADPSLFGTNFVSPPMWLGWTGTGCPEVSPPTCSSGSQAVGAMTGPVDLTANYGVGITMSINPRSESAYIGETVTTDVDVFGGLGNVTVGAIVPPGLVGLITINFWTIQNPAIKENPLTFPSSAESPNGETVVMEVEVSQHATLYGALNFTVTAMSSGFSSIDPDSGGQAICIIQGVDTDVPNCVYTLNIISPTATVIGNAQTPFAITTPGQSSLFYVNGHWLAFYYNGTASSGYLVAVSSQNSNGTLWNPSEVVPSGPGIQGYAYAIAVSGSEVYYVLTSSNNATSGLHWTYFYYNYGLVLSNGTIQWQGCSPSYPSCPTATAMKQQVVAGPDASVAYAAGQPGIAIDPAGNVYAAIPTLVRSSATTPTTPGVPGCSSGALCWRVDLWISAPVGLGGLVWQNNKPIASTSQEAISSLNMKLFSLTDVGTPSLDGIALAMWGGNNASLPLVSVWSSINPGQPEISDCSPESASLGWGIYQMYGAQSDVISNNNVLYFSGVGINSSTNDVVKFYTFSYNGPGCTGAQWSSPQEIGVGAPTNKASYWHVSMSWSDGSIIIGYGIDAQLGFAIGTLSGNNWSWFVLPSVQGLTGIEGGLTAAFAPSGGGTGTVGMIWVQEISLNKYAVEFALA